MFPSDCRKEWPGISYFVPSLTPPTNLATPVRRRFGAGVLDTSSNSSDHATGPAPIGRLQSPQRVAGRPRVERISDIRPFRIHVLSFTCLGDLYFPCKSKNMRYIDLTHRNCDTLDLYQPPLPTEKIKTVTTAHFLSSYGFDQLTSQQLFGAPVVDLFRNFIFELNGRWSSSTS